MVRVQFGNSAVLDGAGSSSLLRVDSELPSEYERKTGSRSPQRSSSPAPSHQSSLSASSAAAVVRRHHDEQYTSALRSSSSNSAQQQHTVREREQYQPQSTFVTEKTGSGVGAGIHYRPSSRVESETLVKSAAKGSIISSGGVHINVYTEPRSMSRNSPARLSDEIEVTYGGKHRQAFTLGLGPDSPPPSATAGPKRVYWAGDCGRSNSIVPAAASPLSFENNKFRSASASRATSSSYNTMNQQQQQSFRSELDSIGSASLGLDLTDRPASGMSTGSSSGRQSVGGRREESPEPTFMHSSASSVGRGGQDSNSNWRSSAADKPPLQLKLQQQRQNSNSSRNEYQIPIRFEGDLHANYTAEGTSPLLAFSPESVSSNPSGGRTASRRPTPIIATTPTMAFSPENASSGSRTPSSPATRRRMFTSNGVSDDDVDDEYDVYDTDSQVTHSFRDDMTMPGTARHPLGHVDVPLRIAGIPDSFSEKDRKLAFSGYGATRKQHAEEDYERRSPKRTMPLRNADLVRELKSKVDSIGERLPSRNGHYAINTEMLERRPFSPKKRFQPEYYMRAIPSYDDNGHPIPEWRRQFIAKQLAGYVKKEFEHDEDLEDEGYFLNKIDALLNDPEWKRKMGLANRPDTPYSTGSGYSRATTTWAE